MKVISICGISDSGKTTTAEHIIKELRRRGYSVGSVKEIHYDQFKMDTEGSNTDRHRRAGSQLVTARGKYETDILFSAVQGGLPEIWTPTEASLSLMPELRRKPWSIGLS